MERISIVKGMGDSTRARENNFTLNGSKELGVEISFPALVRICVAENDRRLAQYDQRLLRPRLVPAAMRFLLRFTEKPRDPESTLA